MTSCHATNEDQVFTCFEGECTSAFPDGGAAVPQAPAWRPLITGGSFYQLENTGKGHMILMGHRSATRTRVIIDYVTRQDIRRALAESAQSCHSRKSTPATSLGRCA